MIEFQTGKRLGCLFRNNQVFDPDEVVTEEVLGQVGRWGEGRREEIDEFLLYLVRIGIGMRCVGRDGFLRRVVGGGRGRIARGRVVVVVVVVIVVAIPTRRRRRRSRFFHPLPRSHLGCHFGLSSRRRGRESGSGLGLVFRLLFDELFNDFGFAGVDAG